MTDAGTLGDGLDVAVDGAPVEGLVVVAFANFEYLEIFHNRQRRHSTLGMLTPVEYETRHQPATAA